MKIIKLIMLGLIGALGLIGNSVNASSPARDMQAKLIMDRIEKHIANLQGANPALAEKLIQSIEGEIPRLNRLTFIKTATNDRRRELIAAWQKLKQEIKAQLAQEPLLGIAVKRAQGAIKGLAEVVEQEVPPVGFRPAAPPIAEIAPQKEVLREEAFKKLVEAAPEGMPPLAPPPVSLPLKDVLITELNELIQNVDLKNFEEWAAQAIRILNRLEENDLSRDALNIHKRRVLNALLSIPINQLNDTAFFERWVPKLENLISSLQSTGASEESITERKKEIGNKVIELINNLIDDPPMDNFLTFTTGWAPVTKAVKDFLKTLNIPEFTESADNATKDLYVIHSNMYLSEVFKDFVRNLKALNPSPERPLALVEEYAENLIQQLEPFNLTARIKAVDERKKQLIDLIDKMYAQGN